MAWAENDKRIFQEVFDEHLHQQLVLKRESPRNSRPDFEAIAFNLGLTPEDLHQKIEADPEHFKKVYTLAQENTLSWEEAESLLQNQTAEGLVFHDRVSKNHNRAPKTPSKNIHPIGMRDSRGIYKNKYKGFSQKGSREGLMARLIGYTRWKEANDAVNNEDLDRHD